MIRSDPCHAVIDAAAALDRGRRERQEDAVATAFVPGGEPGFAILSDGMGGHASGDLASRVIVSEMFAELTVRCREAGAPEFSAPLLLHHALHVANDRLRDHADAGSSHHGMGGTVVAVLIQNGALNWVSVGDSRLYLFRAGQLRQLNEDHSMAPQLDLLVYKGLMTPEAARTHPQRSCLTSAVTGAEIAAIDCPDTGFALQAGDVIVVASDGLDSLPGQEMADLLTDLAEAEAAAIAERLLNAVAAVGDPHQDNTSVVVLRAATAGDLGPKRSTRPAASLRQRLTRLLGPRTPGPAME